MSLSAKAVKVFAAACTVFAAALFFSSRSEVYYYYEKGHPPLGRSSGYTAAIPNTFEGLYTGFSLPHQNRQGDSFWLHLSFSFNPETAKRTPVSFNVLRLAVRSPEGNAVFLEGRRSSNPDFARAVHFEEGALVGLRPVPFGPLFVAGVPFELSNPPRHLLMDYEFLIKAEDGREDRLAGTLELERGAERKFRFGAPNKTGV